MWSLSSKRFQRVKKKGSQYWWMWKCLGIWLIMLEKVESLRKRVECLETILENLVVTNRNSEKGESQQAKPKCRYYNRGFCKFRERCRYYHSAIICVEFLEVGMCRKNGCPDRHPRICKFWAQNPEGCPRKDQCQYLHIRAKMMMLSTMMLTVKIM